jgi:hypothetical protein
MLLDHKGTKRLWFAKLRVPGFPRNHFACFPIGFCLDALSVHSDATSVLFALPPLTSVGPAIGPRENALTVLRILLVVTVVTRTIWPIHPSFAIHVAAYPLPDVNATVDKRIAPFAFHLIVLELTLVNGALSRPVGASAMLVAMKELPFVA